MFKLPEDLESKYKFVTVAALRAEQIQSGALPRVTTPSRKPTVIAQQEVADGMVTEWDPEQEAAEEAQEASDEEE